MSLILNALKKVKELARRKQATPVPAPQPLATFRFGRPTRSQRIRRLAILYVLPATLLLAVAGYTGNFWLQMLSRKLETVPTTPSVAVTAPQATNDKVPSVVVTTEPATAPAEEASSSDDMKTAIVESGKPLKIRVEPDYTLDWWGEVKLDWRWDGGDKIVTLSSDKEVKIKYRLRRN